MTRRVDGNELIIADADGGRWVFSIESERLRDGGFVHPLDIIVDLDDAGRPCVAVIPAKEARAARTQPFASRAEAERACRSVRAVLEAELRELLGDDN